MTSYFNCEVFTTYLPTYVLTYIPTYLPIYLPTYLPWSSYFHLLLFKQLRNYYTIHHLVLCPTSFSTQLSSPFHLAGCCQLERKAPDRHTRIPAVSKFPTRCSRGWRGKGLQTKQTHNLTQCLTCYTVKLQFATRPSLHRPLKKRAELS